MKSSNLILTILCVAPLVLAGCKGGGDDESDDNSSAAANLPFTNSQVLLASFIKSLDPIRDTASRLINNDRRYSVQTSSASTYLDINRNNRFDNGDVNIAGNPLQQAGVHYAHAAGLTGQGEVIAFSDSGFRTTHRAFSGKSITTGAALGETDHGTFVASVAAGNAPDLIGVAPEADVIFGSFANSARLTETANAARAAGAVALNNSWGFIGRDATQSDYNVVFGSGSSYQSYLSALKDYAQSGIVVFASSNERNATTSGLMSALPQFESSLERSWITVINGAPTMSGDDVVSANRISAPCLEAARWCLAANGNWTGAKATSDSSKGFGTGSSFAAPMVSGALALLAEAFPDLSHQDLRIRLLASADNDFSGFNQTGTVELVPGFHHGYSNEWGHGFLDVAAALLPIGQSTVRMGNGTVVNTSEPLVVAGAASGDAVSRALQGVAVRSQDSLAGTFSVDATQLVATRQAPALFSERDILNFERLSVAAPGNAFFGARQGFPVLLGEQDVDVTLFHGYSGGNERMGIGISRNIDLNGSTLKIAASYGEDTAALLSDWNGGTSAAIASFDMAFSTDLSPVSQLRFDLGYAFGQESSRLGQNADVRMTATAVTYAHKGIFTGNDGLSLSLSLPAAISSGATSLSLPVMTASGDSSYQDVNIDLSPKSREIRLAIHYERPLGRHTNFGISLAHAHNRGHIPGRRETALLIGFKRRF